MNRNRAARWLTVVSAVGFVATAAFHGSAYPSIKILAANGPPEIQVLMPALWLVFSFDLVVLGLILAVVAYIPVGGARFIVAIAGLCPLAAATLQLLFLGFVPPTALLLGLAAMTSAAAVLDPRGDLEK